MAFTVTTSWDDGHILDLRLADLLDRCGLKGTFYIARDYVDDRMSHSEIRELATRHEIGAHTLTHPRLTTVDVETARQEIVGSRDWLQDILGQPVTAFCYPRGLWNPAVRDIVAEAGFVMARTVDGYHLTPGSDPLAIPTTIHAYPFPLRPVRGLRARLGPLQKIAPHWLSLRLPLTALRGWPDLALALLGRVESVGGVWHLWGHSWEIEQYGLWDALETVLAEVARRPGWQPVTNSALVQEG